VLDRVQDLMQVAGQIIGWSAMLFTAVTLLLAIAAVVGFREYREIERVRKEMVATLDRLRERQAAFDEDARRIEATFAALALRLENETRNQLQATYLFSRASQAYDLGKYQQAASLYAAVSELRPSDPIPDCKVGRCLTYLEQYVDAAICFTSALKKDPQCADAHYGRAIIRRFDDLDEALADCSRAIEMQPQNADFRDYMGILLAQKGKYADALAQHQAAYKERPSHDTCFHLSLLHRRFGNEAQTQRFMLEARDGATRALDADRRQIWAHVHIWYYHAANGQVDAALQALENLKHFTITPRLKRAVQAHMTVFGEVFGQSHALKQYALKLDEVAAGGGSRAVP